MNRRRSDQFLTRPHIFTIAFFASFLFLLYQMLRLLAPFSAALLWAGIIVLALHPLYRKLVALFRGRTALAASVMTLVTLVIIIGPAILLLTVLVSQTVDLYHWATEGVKSGAAFEMWHRATDAISSRMLKEPLFAQLDLNSILVDRLKEISAGLAAQVGTILRDVLLLIVNVFIMLIAVFFFFRSGDRYYEATMQLIPFSDEQKQGIAQKLHDTFTAVINGVFLIALGQGLMTGIGFAVFGVPFPVFWGFVAAIAALIPVGGTALVWIPGAIYLFLSHATVSGVLLALWGALLVSLPDNFLKPLVIGKRAKIPTFILFIGILGGLRVYGLLGILFGPLIVTMLTALIKIYREEFFEQDGPD